MTRTAKMAATQPRLPLGPANPRRQSDQDQFCLYCGHPADTREHVPPKALLEEPWPNNLRTVPACGDCNGSWSLDEEYLAIVLTHIGHAPQLAAKVEDGGKFDRALKSFPKLDDRIIRSLSVADDGGVRFQPEMERIREVVEKVAFGLHALRYGRGAKRSDFSCVAIAGPGEELPPPLVAALWIWPGIRRKSWTKIQPRVFRFLFAKGWMAGDASLYCFIDLHETLVAVVTCPPPVVRKKGHLPSAPW